MINPSDMTGILSQRTYTLKEQMWFTSLSENLPIIRGERSLMSLDKHLGPAIVVGAGPSVTDEVIAQLAEKLPKLKNVAVLSTDRMLVKLLKAGITPSIVASLDGDPQVAEFYKDPVVKENYYDVKACLATYIHPSVVAACPFRRYWFNVIFDDPINAEVSVSRVLYWMTNQKTLTNGLGNVGAWLAMLANELESSPIILVGIDFSYGENAQPMRTMYWEGLLTRYNGDRRKVIKQCYRYETTPFGKRVLTDVVMDSYRDTLMKGIEATKAQIWNTSETSILHGAGVKSYTLTQALQQVSQEP